MTVDQTLQQVFRLAVPEAALVATACVLYLLGTLAKPSRHVAGVFALVGIGVAAALHFTAAPPGDLVRTVSPLWIDHLAVFVRLASFATAAILVLFSWNECGDARSADFHACLLIAAAGTSLVGSANDLIVLFLALEMLSIPTYVMLYLPRPDDAKSQEAAVKYFLLSVLSSALMLFGFSHVYGMTGGTNLSAITEILPRLLPGDGATTATIALVFVVAGLGFRVAAFPFHFYAPDVYQGGPTGPVAFLAFVPKIAGFVAMLKAFAFIPHAWLETSDFASKAVMLLWILAAATMTVGNVLGLLQKNLRRMLAYSSVANAGYLMIGLAVTAVSPTGGKAAVVPGSEALLFYLIAYGLMTVGAFAVLAHLDSPARRVETIDDIAGLRETHPLSALLLGVFLLSMIGLPLTAGFVGKFSLFAAALSLPDGSPMTLEFRWLVVIAALNAATAAYYYLRVLMAVFLRTPLTPTTPTHRFGPLTVVALLCGIATVGLGCYPRPLQMACAWAVGG